MTAVAAPGGRPAGRARELTGQWAAILLCVSAASGTGLLILGGASKNLAVIPLGLVATVGMVLLALSDFTAFVILVLGIRAMMDWSKSAPSHVGGAGASPGNAASVLAVLFMGAGATWLLAHRRAAAVEAEPRFSSTLAPALLIFLAAAYLSVLGSSSRSVSALEALRVTSAVLMLVVLERLMVDRKTVQRVLAACIVSSLVPGIAGALQLASGGGRFTAGGYSRIRGTFVHPNPFAIYLSFVLVLACALFFQTPPRLRPWLALLMAGDALCLLLTYTRTGWVATVAGVFVLCLLNGRLRQFLVVGAVATILLSPFLVGRLADLTQTHRASGTAGNSLIWRAGYWTEILPLANRNPITGIGLKMTQKSAVEQKEPHNDAIRSYVETGLLGLVAYIGVQVAVWKTVRQALRRTKGRRGFDRAVATGFAGSATVFSLVSIVSNVISSSVLLWYFFAFAAAAGAIARWPEGDA